MLFAEENLYRIETQFIIFIHRYRLIAAQRFSGHVTFLGVRAGVVYLRVRDGSWVRRAQAFESRILHDLKTLCELKTEPQRIKVMVGEPSSES